MKTMQEKKIFFRGNIARVGYISSVLLTQLEVSDENIYPKQRMNTHICKCILVKKIPPTRIVEEMALK